MLVSVIVTIPPVMCKRARKLHVQIYFLFICADIGLHLEDELTFN